MTKPLTRPQLPTLSSSETLTTAVTPGRTPVHQQWDELPRALREALTGRSGNLSDWQQLLSSIPSWHELRPVVQSAIDHLKAQLSAREAAWNEELERLASLTPQQVLRERLTHLLSLGQPLADIAQHSGVTTADLTGMATGQLSVKPTAAIAEALGLTADLLRPRHTSEVDPLGISHAIRSELNRLNINARSASESIGMHYSYISVQLAHLERNNAISISTANKLLGVAQLQILIDDEPLNSVHIREMAAAHAERYTQLASSIGIDRRTFINAMQVAPQTRSQHLVHAWEAAGHYIGLGLITPEPLSD